MNESDSVVFSCEGYSPAFVIPLRDDAMMECGKTYEAMIVPTPGEFLTGDFDYGVVQGVVRSIAGCRLAHIQVNPHWCVVRWSCHNSCPRVGSHSVYEVADLVCAALKRQFPDATVSRVGMVWIQANAMYIAGGLLAAGIGAIGATLVQRFRKNR